MRFVEVFNRANLLHIVKYENYFKTLLNNDEDGDEKYAQFTLYKKYLLKADGPDNNRIVVNYSKNKGRGRFFAGGSLSLQSFNKLVRGSIAGDYYYDVDMRNCHPVLLGKICDDKGFACYNLNVYVANREAVLKDILVLNPDKTREEIKKCVISMIYGGNVDYESIKKPSNWLIKFREEICEIHSLVKEWYPKLYKKESIIKEYNLEGSVLSIGLCIFEDKILQTVIQYFKDCNIVDHVLVLCFDGIMIPKNKLPKGDSMDDHINKIEMLVKEKHLIDMKFTVKEFEKLPLDIPDDYVLDIPDEEEAIYDVKNEYRYGDMYWYDFVKKNTKMTFDSFTELYEILKCDVKKVCMKVYTMEDHLIRKIDDTHMFEFDKKLPSIIFKYNKLMGNGKTKTCNISFKKLLDTGLVNEIPVYNSLTIQPSGVYAEQVEEGDRYFNTWTGFKAKLVNKVDVSKIQIILDHIKKVWCSDNLEYYNYIISWFHTIFTNPSLKSKVAVVLKSNEKQIGKGILINDFLIPLVFGEQYAMSIAGLDTITCKFNDILINKIFINCDELSTLDGSFHQSFDVLKKRITDKTIKIEIKGGKSFIYPDHANYMMCTNFNFTIRMEQGDCRYFTLECSPCFKGNYGYFNTLVESMNQESADHFLTYVCEFKDLVDVRNIPMSNLKREMMINSLPNCLRFLMNLNLNLIKCLNCERGKYVGKCDCDESFISFKSMYARYLGWCDDGKEKAMSLNNFSRKLKYSISKMTQKRTKGYNLKSINVKL